MALICDVIDLFSVVSWETFDRLKINHLKSKLWQFTKPTKIMVLWNILVLQPCFVFVFVFVFYSYLCFDDVSGAIIFLLQPCFEQYQLPLWLWNIFGEPRGGKKGLKVLPLFKDISVVFVYYFISNCICICKSMHCYLLFKL